MGFCSTATQNAILNYYFNTGAMPTITGTKLYMGLCTSLNSGASVSGEPTLYGYTRVEINVSAATPFFTAATAGTNTNNNNAITFPVNTAGGNWGALGYWFISTVSTVGNTAFVFGGQINGGAGVTVNETQAPTFALNQLALNATGF